jgi:hypothetical protein
MMPAMNRTGRGMNATPVVAEIGWDTKIESERDNDNDFSDDKLARVKIAQ